jgi:hypothetical protein
LEAVSTEPYNHASFRDPANSHRGLVRGANSGQINAMALRTGANAEQCQFLALKISADFACASAQTSRPPRAD